MHRLASDSDDVVVAQATGALMLHYRIATREALAVLDRWALEARVPVREIAEALVSGVCLGRVTAETAGTVRWLEERLRGEVDEVDDTRDGHAARDARGVAEGLAPMGTTVVATVTAPAPAAEAGTRQWRYSSAVHAARVIRSH